MPIVITKKFPWTWVDKLNIDKLDIKAIPADKINDKINGKVNTQHKQNTQSINSNSNQQKILKIGILNLMPNVQETELQWANVLSNDEFYVDLHFFNILSRTSSHETPQHFEKFYDNWTTFNLSTLNGFIITGAPLEQVDYKDVTYWEEFGKIIDKLNQLDIYTLLICWSAQAVAYYLHDIKPTQLSCKLSGVYEQNLVENGHCNGHIHSQLTTNLPNPILCCVSRHTTIREEDCKDKLDFLLHSDICGVGVAIDKKYSNLSYSFNHIEYDKFVLNNEYIRDISKGRNDVHPPYNYFVDDDAKKAEIKYDWKETQARFFLNWLHSASNWSDCEYT